MVGSYKVYKTNEVSKDGCIEVAQGGRTSPVCFKRFVRFSIRLPVGSLPLERV